MPDDALSRTRIVLRPVASPLPLGFFAFGMGIVLTALLDLHVLPVTDSHQVAVLLLTFTAPLELLGAVFALLARDVGAGTALGVFGATWVSTGVSQLLAPPGARSPVTGAFSLALAVIFAVLALAARSGKPALGVLLTLATARFLCSGLYAATEVSGLQVAAGCLGLLIVVFSLYGLALLLEDGSGHTVLPLGRRGRARESFDAGLPEQLTGVDSEAGVRNQL